MLFHVSLVLMAAVGKGLTEQDLVFITGGIHPYSKQIMDSYEIYTGHLGENYTLCDYKLDKVNDAAYGSAGIYLPGYGLHICGGVKVDNKFAQCSYNNLGGFYSQWTYFKYSSNTGLQNGVTESEMLLFKNKKEDPGFLHIGGRSTDGYYHSSVLTFEPKKGYNNGAWNKIGSFDNNTNEGGVFATTIFSFKYNKVAHLIFALDSITACYCMDTTVKFCDAHEKNWNCLFESKEIDPRGVTTISISNNEEAAVLLTTTRNYLVTISNWTLMRPVFHFDNITDGGFLNDGSLVTVNGVATYFGTTLINDKTVNNAVVQYNYGENTWKEIKSTETSRVSQTVVVIPESWLCNHTATTPSPSTTAACPMAGTCSKRDSRGIFWEANFGEQVSKYCSSESQEEGEAFWFCDGCIGGFSTSEPDRSACIDPWILDVEEMLSNGSSAFSISVTLVNNLAINKDSYGGSILKIGDALTEVLDKRKNEDIDDNDMFTSNLINSTDLIFGTSTGWKEIVVEEERSGVVSKYLEALDYTGFLWAEKKLTRSECNVKKSFLFNNLKLIAKVAEVNENNEIAEECFSFGSGTICIPLTKVQEEDMVKCNVLVATMITTKEDKEQDSSFIFPNTLSDNPYREYEAQNENYYEGKSVLGKELIGLTINNKTHPISPSDDSPIKITFNHQLYLNQEGCLFTPRTPACVYWSLETNTWSSLGCKVDPLSTRDETICLCNHLTNFGIMLDWEGDAPANDPTLNGITTFLLVFSCIALIMTEILLRCQRKDARNQLRKVAETNRNILLLIAQIAFLFLAGSYSSVTCTACQVFGGIIHFFWLTFFAWTVIEGYFFYSALVTVFEPGTFSMIKFYAVGYGIPAFIVIVTTTVSMLTDGFLYLRRDDENRVNSCFLGGNAIFAMVVPAGLVVLLNTGVTVIAVFIAHKAGKRRNVGGQAQAISMLRNTLLISLLLGLTWMVGFLPTSTLQQYSTVFLNASMGIYILFYSVLANTQVRGEVKTRVSGIMTSSSNKKEGTTTKQSTLTSKLQSGIEISPELKARKELYPSPEEVMQIKEA